MADFFVLAISWTSTVSKKKFHRIFMPFEVRLFPTNCEMHAPGAHRSSENSATDDFTVSREHIINDKIKQYAAKNPSRRRYSFVYFRFLRDPIGICSIAAINDLHWLCRKDIVLQTAVIEHNANFKFEKLTVE